MDKELSSRQALHRNDKYVEWLEDLKNRYLKQRLKAMTAVNNNVLESIGTSVETSLANSMPTHTAQHSTRLLVMT